jgi:hypothetical protein
MSLNQMTEEIQMLPRQLRILVVLAAMALLNTNTATAQLMPQQDLFGDDAMLMSSAVVNANSDGSIGGDFTNAYFPATHFDPVWIDEPSHGTVSVDMDSGFVRYQPSPTNLHEIDKFTVYATDNDSNWNISTFFFDPETSELTFVTDVTNDPVEIGALHHQDAYYCSAVTAMPATRGAGWTRFWGGVKLVGGVLETAGGVVIGVGTSWTGAVAGGGIAIHGADTAQAGLRQLWYGEEVRTFTSQAVSGTAHNVFGVDEDKAVVIGEIVDAGAGLAGGLGTVSKGPQIVDKFGDVFELSTSVRVALPGGGYIDETIDLSDDIADIIRGGGVVSTVDDLGQLHAEHIADWDLRGPRGGHIDGGTEISGVDFPLPKGTRLSFPEQSWYGHTEGKVILDLWESGKLKPGRTLDFDGELPPCSQCKNIMKWASETFEMTIVYVDKDGTMWVWINGVLQ